MAALGGFLLAPYSGVIFAEMGMQYAILAFIVVIIGGLGSVQGSAIASLIVGLAGAFTAYFIPDLSLAINMLMLLFFLIVKPTGLVGEKGEMVNNTSDRIKVYFGVCMLICLSVFPFVNDSRSLLILFTQIFIFAIFAMSFDVLLGYTGIVSFGHCMFFGIGAYGVALLFDRQGVSITNF